jgi:GNAT superfamily N-acetyltransferase
MPSGTLDRMIPTEHGIAVSLVDTAASKDADLVYRLTRLINDVYAIAESGLWQEGTPRTTTSQVAELIEAGEVAVARVQGRIAGAIRVHEVSEDTAEFGLLVAAPEHRSIGVGRALVSFAERFSSEHGMRAMRLEVLVPRAWRHPSKEYLDHWYRRLGYRVTGTTDTDDSEPELAPLLATACDFVVYEKPLGPPSEPTSGSACSEPSARG